MLDKIEFCDKCGLLERPITQDGSVNASANSAPLPALVVPLAPARPPDPYSVPVWPEGSVTYAPPVFYALCTCQQEALK